MLTLGYTLWLISIIYIDIFLPLGCSAVIEEKEIWMKDEKNEQDTFISRPPWEPLGWEDNRMKTYPSTNGAKQNRLIFLIICGIAALVAIIVKCCKYMIEEEANANRNGQFPYPVRNSLSHIPTRTRLPTRPSSGGSINSRPFTSPARSSRSIILLPEGLMDSNHLLIGIENPSYFPSSTIAADVFTRESREEPRRLIFTERNQDDIISTPLLDSPPDYESVVKTDSQKSDSKNNITNNLQKDFDDTAPPKYTDLQKKG